MLISIEGEKRNDPSTARLSNCGSGSLESKHSVEHLGCTIPNAIPLKKKWKKETGVKKRKRTRLCVEGEGGLMAIESLENEEGHEREVVGF
ncbi:hypothetical protein SDJN03_10421, partial [Cucurbita argyrosperma subsp. sororia]